MVASPRLLTIRGIKIGVHEIDLLAIAWREGGKAECRHIEVQASMRPMSFISKVPKSLQKEGRAVNSAKRSNDELEQGVKEWVHTKFKRTGKVSLMQTLWKGSWTSELVLNIVKSETEVDLIRQHGVSVMWLPDIVASLEKGKFPVQSASGADLVDLLHMGKSPNNSL